MPINPIDFLETLVSLPIKYKYKNWFYSNIWLTINMAGRNINYLLYEIIKYFQNQY